MESQAPLVEVIHHSNDVPVRTLQDLVSQDDMVRMRNTAIRPSSPRLGSRTKDVRKYDAIAQRQPREPREQAVFARRQPGPQENSKGKDCPQQ